MCKSNFISARGGCLLLLGLASLTGSAAAAEAEDKSRFSDQPAPLRLHDFPERPAPLIELGDDFLGNGNLQRGFTLPTGAVWSPNLWVFGTMRSALQSFDSGTAPQLTEWANRLDIFANLQLSPTERVLVGFRPLDQKGTRFSGYTFKPDTINGWDDNFSGTPRTFFFEGELGEIFPNWDKSDRRSLDYSLAVGRQPLILQDGLLVNDDSIDMVSITRNSLNIPGGSTLRISPYFAWSEIERANNVQDKDALMVGINAAADFSVSTVDADLIYVPSSGGGDGLYAGLGAVQRIGKFNTTFRINHSVALEDSSARVRNGTLLFGELSYTMPYGVDLVYLNGFWGFGSFTSADRAPTSGGPLGRLGILNAAVGLGRYGAPLSNQADHAAGAALGYQMFFGELRRRQLLLEIGGRTATRDPILVREQTAYGIGLRYQQAFGRRLVLVLDTFGVSRETVDDSYGGRLELLVKF